MGSTRGGGVAPRVHAFRCRAITRYARLRTLLPDAACGARIDAWLTALWAYPRGTVLPWYLPAISAFFFFCLCLPAYSA
jgi:hypothetical protein